MPFSYSSNLCFYCHRIDSIPLSVFTEMHSLEAIKLSNNEIKHLPQQAFQSVSESRAIIDVHGMYRLMFSFFYDIPFFV